MNAFGRELTQDELDDTLRQDLYKTVYEEFVGPMDFDAAETLPVRPTERYAAGVLHPIGSEFSEYSDTDGTDVASVGPDTDDPTVEVGTVPESVPLGGTSEEEYEEPISLSNARSQSAISMTIAVRRGDRVAVKARAATYAPENVDGRRAYVRRPHRFELKNGEVEIPRTYGPPTCYALDGKGLELWIVFRRHAGKADVVTVALCNTNRETKDPAKCYFQASLKIESELGLLPPTWTETGGRTPSDEEAGKRLIYRNIRNYAVGHGCATEWQRGETVRWARTRVMPWADAHPMKAVHPDMRGVKLALEELGRPERWDKSLAAMREMCLRYGSWIDRQEDRIATLPSEHTDAARRNVKLCRTCLSRMEDGIDALQADAVARRAFVMMNEAMYDQYLHYSVVSGERRSLLEPPSYVRQWRPFQLAFILMNVRPMIDERCPERRIVDLIWFPTGGGKTEAYLGLSAFALIHERLSSTCSKGVTVIMRYTLRLLTSQQFDRASSLICALESMRRRMPEALGQREFRIGLWVGGEASPNKRSEAESKRAEYCDRNGDKNPFPVRCCPWCGTDMEARRRQSYRKVGRNSLSFYCPSGSCEFSGGDGLPLDVVDEEIYDRPPSLMVGTIDKFAMLPYRSEAFPLFGIVDGKRRAAPKLIIQDELHLISGPLGSMAAHYETLISELCSREVDGASVAPKIIASTATVSRAIEQCNQLYACGEDYVFQFPPSGIDHDDSFFSKEDSVGRGRRYVGVFVPDLTAATASIRLYADLMWAPASWQDVPDDWRDRYWTTVGYYGTTRELGQAVTWMGGDIPERLREHRRRAQDAGADIKRYINVGIELTGRKDADEVKAGLDSLKIPYPDKRAIDLCFATNMISVGLDVGRLGLMVVAGQPKSTAEYIQATSRVGRGDAKGIVFVVYSTTKPRDRSHYENFAMFHESFYQNVEPSSVTAFCRQVRDRALFGTTVGIYRSLTEGVIDDAYERPEEDQFERAVDAVRRRILKVEPEELDGFEEDIRDIQAQWETGDFERWDELRPEGMLPPTPLMHPRGADESDQWSGSTFEVPTSMRSVDQECRLAIVGAYGGYERSGNA